MKAKQKWALSRQELTPRKQPESFGRKHHCITFATKTIVVVNERKDTVISKLNWEGAQTLMEADIEPPTWLVEGLLPTSSTNILAAQPKLGKSLLCLQLSQAVSMGTPFLDRKTYKADVLYLALEETRYRLQKRLWELSDQSTDNFRLVEAASTLDGNLIEQIKVHLQEFKNTKLVIIDTLQKIRAVGNGDYSYARDYNDLNKLKAFAEENKICLLIVHHSKKESGMGSDEFANISGTYGLNGSVDGLFLMTKDSRGSKDCTLSVTGRDIENMEIKLHRDGLFWNHVETLGADDLANEYVPEFIKIIAKHFAAINETFEGTTTDLIAALNLTDVVPAVLGKRLNQHKAWLADNGVQCRFKRSSDKRSYFIESTVSSTNDSNDSNDAKSGSEKSDSESAAISTVMSSLPSQNN